MSVLQRSDIPRLTPVARKYIMVLAISAFGVAAVIGLNEMTADETSVSGSAGSVWTLEDELAAIRGGFVSGSAGSVWTLEDELAAIGGQTSPQPQATPSHGPR